jgi:acyl dehydratase
MRFFEDLNVGDTFHTAETVVTAEDITRYGREFDPQPFHVDAEAARKSFFGQLVASGWHTAGVSMRLMVTSEMRLDEGVVGQGVESLRWPRPVFPGDRLKVECRVEEKHEKRGRDDYGTVKLRCVTRNQDGKIVQDMAANLLVKRRPSFAKATEGKPEGAGA